jgi:hypothetical protein
VPRSSSTERRDERGAAGGADLRFSILGMTV